MRVFVLLIAAAAPLAAQCAYTAAPATFSVPATGDIRRVTVNAPADTCTWQYSADVTWITFGVGPNGQPNTSGQGTGTGTFSFSAAPNPDPDPANRPRVGHIQVTDTKPSVNQPFLITITQDAPVCTLALNPTSANLGVGGATASFNVQTNCRWGAGSSQPWATLAPPTGGTASAALTYTAAANPCVSTRTAVVTVSVVLINQFYTIAQDGSPDNLTIAPTSFAATADETTGSFAVNAGTVCGWSASSEVSWLQILSGASGAGNGRVGFKAIKNTGVARTGTIRVGARVFTVTQPAQPVTPVVLTALANAASGAQGSVSPGGIAELFGTNMGPTKGVGTQLLPDGTVAKNLSGTRVLFDGKESALTYSSAIQVNAVVPYSLVPGTTTQIVVEYQGVQSAALALPVKAVTPGIFTQDSSGLGNGAILNQNYDINTRLNPAARGDIIMIYATGGGITSPPSSDGSVTGVPLPLLTQPVTVTIGGIDAPVGYKGGAPGAVAGVTQINAQVPSAVTPGTSVPIVITIGGVPSPPGVTVAVK